VLLGIGIRHGSSTWGRVESSTGKEARSVQMLPSGKVSAPDSPYPGKTRTVLLLFDVPVGVVISHESVSWPFTGNQNTLGIGYKIWTRPLQ
jgi:hypothetical protein